MMTHTRRRAFGGRRARRSRVRASEAVAQGSEGFDARRRKSARASEESSQRVERRCGVGDIQCDDIKDKTHLNIRVRESCTLESFRKDE